MSPAFHAVTFRKSEDVILAGGGGRVKVTFLLSTVLTGLAIVNIIKRILGNQGYSGRGGQIWFLIQIFVPCSHHCHMMRV